MSSMRNLFFGIVAFSFLLFANTSVGAYPAEEDDAIGGSPSIEKEGKGPGKWREKKFDEFFGQLNLTEEQKQQLKENKASHREKNKSSFEQAKSYREAMKNELMKPELDMSKIYEIHSQLKTLHAQMADDRLSSILEVRKILTPEQFSKFISLMEERRSKFWSEHKRKGNDQ